MSLIKINNILVKRCKYGYGVFANKNINKGDLIERGLMVPINIDGNYNTHVFSWGKQWTFGSGCSTFYNTSLNPNCIMNRYYDKYKYDIFAIKDINAGEELTHKYISLEWREAFKGLKDIN